MKLLPACILLTEIKGSGVLEVWRQNGGFVASFTWQLDTEVPSIQGDEGELIVVRSDMLMDEGIEARDSILERARATHVFPSQSGQARWWKCQQTCGYELALIGATHCIAG